MYNLSVLKLIPSLITFSFFLIPCVAAQHIILIGIDGMSTEGFQAAKAPNMMALVKNGVVSLHNRGVMPTVSAPNWSSHLSGAGPEQTGVTYNDWTMTNHSIMPAAQDEDGHFPTVFTTIRLQQPEAVTGMFYDWDWLGLYVNKKYIDRCEYLKTYKDVTAAATNFIREKKPLFTFIYYGHPDEVGHEKGHMTPEYLESIGEIDGEVGEIVKSCREAGIFDNTVFYIVSDHGGVGYGHGGESMAELETPFILSGPGIGRDRVMTKPTNVFDSSPTILALLGLTQPEPWVGRPAREAFAVPGEGKEKGRSFVPRPVTLLRDGIVFGSRKLELMVAEGCRATYTLDGSEPGEGSPAYSAPFTLTKSGKIKFRAFRDGNASETGVLNITIVDGIRIISLKDAPSSKYKAMGAPSLVDGRYGTSNFHEKAWLGFDGYDLCADIEFREERDIHGIGVSFFDEAKSWIFPPTGMEVFVPDGRGGWTAVQASGEPRVERPADQPFRGRMVLETVFRADSIRVVIHGLGICPTGHPGEGKKAWLFVDEIIFE